MAAIFTFQHTQMSGSILNSLSVLPGQENMGIVVGISFLSCIWAEIYDIAYVLPVNAAMIDLPVTPTTESLHTSVIVLLYPENVGIAVEIPLSATIQDLQSELQVFPGITSAILISGCTRLDFARCDIVGGSVNFSVLEN